MGASGRRSPWDFVNDYLFYGYFSPIIRYAHANRYVSSSVLPDLFAVDDVDLWAGRFLRACGTAAYTRDGKVARLALLRALLSVFQAQLAAICGIACIKLTMQIYCISLTRSLVNLFETSQEKTSSIAMACVSRALAALVAAWGEYMATSQLEFWKSRMAMRMEGALTAVIYRRAVLSTAATSKSDSKPPVNCHNVLVLDIPSVAKFFTVAADVIMVPVYCFWIFRLLRETTSDEPALAGTIAVCAAMAACFLMEMFNGILKAPLLRARDVRIARTEEALGQVRQLRQLDVVGHAEKEVQVERQREMKVRSMRMQVHCLSWTLSSSIHQVVQALVLGLYVYRGSQDESFTFAASNAIAVLQIISKFVQPLSRTSLTAHVWLESMVALSRTSRHLFERGIMHRGQKLSEPFVPPNSVPLSSSARTLARQGTGNRLVKAAGEILIDVHQAEFSWTSAASALPGNAISIPSLQVRRGEVAFIVGKAGSGKSSAIMALSGELQLRRGRSYVRRSPALSERAEILAKRMNGPVRQAIGFLRQNAWLNEGTARDIIVFGRERDFVRYQAAVTASGLDEDFANWAEGDARRVVQGGHNLSGGQCVRMSLCRALYSFPIPESEVELRQLQFGGCIDQETRFQGSDVFLLDTPFHGLDPRLGLEAFASMFGHQVGLLRYAATVITLDENALKFFLSCFHPKELAVRVMVYDATKGNLVRRPQDAVSQLFARESVRAARHRVPRSYHSVFLSVPLTRSVYGAGEDNLRVLSKASNTCQPSTQEDLSTSLPDGSFEVTATNVYMLKAAHATRNGFMWYAKAFGRKRGLLLLFASFVVVAAKEPAQWMATLLFDVVKQLESQPPEAGLATNSAMHVTSYVPVLPVEQTSADLIDFPAEENEVAFGNENNPVSSDQYYIDESTTADRASDHGTDVETPLAKIATAAAVKHHDSSAPISYAAPVNDVASNTRSKRRTNREGPDVLESRESFESAQKRSLSAKNDANCAGDDIEPAFIEEAEKKDYMEANGQAIEAEANEKETVARPSSASKVYVAFVTIFVSLSMFSVATKFVLSFWETYRGCEASKLLHNELLASVLRSSFWIYDLLGMGTLMTNFNSDMHIIDLVPVYPFLRAWDNGIPLLLISLSLLVLSTWMLVLLPLAGAPVYFLAYRYYQPATSAFMQAKLGAYTPLFGSLTDAHHAAVEIRNLGVTDLAHEDFAILVRDLMKAQFAILGNDCWCMLRMQMLVSPMAALSYMTPILRSILPASDAALALLPKSLGNVDAWQSGLAGLGVMLGSRLPLVMTEFMMATAQLAVHLVPLQRLFILKELILALARDEKMLGDGLRSKRPAIAETDERLKKWRDNKLIVEMNNLSAGYGRLLFNAAQARDVRRPLDALRVEPACVTLQDITCEIREGELIGVAGRSGAGKTSLLLTLAGFLPTMGGTILMKGTRGELVPQSTLKEVAYLPQFPAVMSGWTVRFILDPTGIFPDELLWKVLTKLGLARVVSAAEGLDSVVSSRSIVSSSTATTSADDAGEDNEDDTSTDDDGGNSGAASDAVVRSRLIKKSPKSEYYKLLTDTQLRLLWMGRLALRDDYCLILVDEPPHKQKNSESMSVCGILRTLFPSSAVIVVAHHADVLRDCDRVWVMHQGRIRLNMTGDDFSDQDSLANALKLAETAAM